MLLKYTHTNTHKLYTINSNVILARNFWCNKLKSDQRIGPHSEEIYSCIIGNVLGDGHLEYRSGSTRLTLHLGLPNREYIAWLHNLYVTNGYCTNKELIFKKRIGKNDKIYFTTKIITYSFKSLNWLHELFYIPQYDENNELICYKKIVPANILDYLTPQVIAIWIMDDGSRQNSGIYIHTNSFTLEENFVLQEAFLKKYNIKTTLHKKGFNYALYFPFKEAQLLKKIVEPYMHKSMLYKVQNS